MDDLTKRAKKYSRGAGRTQTGHYDAAHKKARYHRVLGSTSVVLSTLVGGSIFVRYGDAWPMITGVLAILSAVVGSINTTTKFGEEAEKHRVAGANYGDIRRTADMLVLKMAAGDIQREEALSELETIGTRMSTLAKESISLPDSIYFPARKKFDTEHDGGENRND
jgi:hypothetical protein